MANFFLSALLLQQSDFEFVYRCREKPPDHSGVEGLPSVS
jgi:hypothetical protein